MTKTSVEKHSTVPILLGLEMQLLLQHIYLYVSKFSLRLFNKEIVV